MILDGQEISILAADAHHHRSSVALMGVIHPGDRQSSTMSHYEKRPAPNSRVVWISENHMLPDRGMVCID